MNYSPAGSARFARLLTGLALLGFAGGWLTAQDPPKKVREEEEEPPKNAKALPKVPRVEEEEPPRKALPKVPVVVGDEPSGKAPASKPPVDLGGASDLKQE